MGSVQWQPREERTRQDAEAVELTVVDLRWQMVLGVLRAQKPAFSQGAITCVAALLKWSASRVCAEAGVPALDALSVKRGLDLGEELKRAPLKDLMETLGQIIKQEAMESWCWRAT
jgi:hypothetical protein